MKTLLYVAIIAALCLSLLAVTGCNGGNDDGINTTVNLTASETTVTEGETITLSWTSENALSVRNSTFGATDTSGSADVVIAMPAEGRTVHHSIAVQGSDEVAYDAVTITVTPAF